MKTLLTKIAMFCGAFMLCMVLYGCEGDSTGPQGQQPNDTPPPGHTPAPAPGGDLPPEGVSGSGARGGN